MKKVSSLDDLLSPNPIGENVNWTTEGPLFDELKESDSLRVFPADNMVAGTFGCVVFRDEVSKRDEEPHFTYSMKVFDAAEKIVHDRFGSFKQVLDEAVEKDWPCFSVDDPKRLRMGFLILKNSRNEWHSVRSGAYKRWRNTTE